MNIPATTPLNSPLNAFNLARGGNAPAERAVRTTARPENAGAPAAGTASATLPAVDDEVGAASLTALLSAQMRSSPSAFLAAQGLQRPVSLNALLRDE